MPPPPIIESTRPANKAQASNKLRSKTESSSMTYFDFIVLLSSSSSF